MRVLSLFDWISCWYEALLRAWFKIDKYYASEVDKYAIQVATKNHPDIIEIWDVTQVKWEDYKDVDIIIWWSPCQWFSLAWKQLNFDDERSKLFFEFLRLVQEIKPKYFLLENVKMKKEFRDKISELMWCEPILIDSALVSAQHRERYYWTNIPWVCQPEDRWLLLKDILEDEVDEKYNFSKERWERITATNYEQNKRLEDLEWKCNTLVTNSWGNHERKVCIPNDRKIKRVWWLYWQTTRWWMYDDSWIAPTITASMWMWWWHVPYVIPSKYFISKQHTDAMIRARSSWKLNLPDREWKCWTLIAWYYKTPQDWPYIAYAPWSREFETQWFKEDKSPTLCARDYKDPKVVATKQENWFIIRKLTPVECERLQTLPDNYTAWVSDTQRYKQLGNWWTVDVIAHIFSFIPKE